MPSHQRHQLRRDRQAQAGAAVTAIVAAFDLLERIEDKALFFSRNADARIRHLEMQSAE